MAQTCAVFGLGSMGKGIAVSLLRAAGHRVFGFDVNPAAIDALASDGLEAGSVAEAGRVCDTVIVVVLNAAQMEQVLFGENSIVAELRPGSTVIACPTVAPDIARDMERRCQLASIHYLDAPISGGAFKSARGELSVMASGTPAAFEASAAVLRDIAQTVFELGDSAGAGSAMKAINQLLAGVHIASMAEAMTFGMSQGVEGKQILDVIAKCAGNSWMFENRAPHIIDGDYTPHSAINIWPKDLGIVLEIAQQSDFSAPLAAAALKQFEQAVDMGLASEDDAAVAKVYAQQAKLQLP